MNNIIQLKITLEWTNPPIWRRVLVEKQTTFYELHYIIQLAMGWDNCHLYEFKYGNYLIGDEGGELDDDFSFGKNKLLDAEEVTLGSIITDTKQKFNYEYDFGDGWRHTIVVEKFLAREEETNYPKCTAGELNCPPEDSGGVPGFYDLLEIISNKQHPEREEMLEWIGGSYDPEYFDINEVNKKLKNLDKYVKGWLGDV